MIEWFKSHEEFCISCPETSALYTNEIGDVNDDGQCKVCFDKGLVECYQCSEFGSKDDYIDAEDGDWICDDCYTPTCQYCNEEVEEDGDFCCDDCVKGFKYDMRDK
jgi:hypothetical protein|tara:strand:- start:81 stop:398 length:318 start_codon:yes stop_codon:yes gene_type:complete